VSTASSLGLLSRPMRIARQEGISLPPGATLSLAQLTGSGTIVELSLAVGSTGTAGPYDSILSVTTDCRPSPDWTSDLGTLFASQFGQNLNAQWSCDKAHVEIQAGGTAVGYVFSQPMPYRNGAGMDLYNSTPDTLTIWSQVVYALDAPAPVRLRGQGRTWPNRLGVRAVDPARLLTAPTGGGWLAWLSLIGQANSGTGSAALGWMERNLEYTTDQASSPQWASTGLEDVFGGSFYFQGRQGFGMPWSLVGAVDTTRRVGAMAVDFVRLYGGMRFDNGMRLDLAAQPGAPDHLQSWLALYYEDVS
jgi:hypothetical protein